MGRTIVTLIVLAAAPILNRISAHKLLTDLLIIAILIIASMRLMLFLRRRSSLGMKPITQWPSPMSGALCGVGTNLTFMLTAR